MVLRSLRWITGMVLLAAVLPAAADITSVQGTPKKITLKAWGVPDAAATDIEALTALKTIDVFR